MPVPKYHQVYLVLREQLHEGRFADGVPGEMALMGEFGVARVTVRKALERLATEGLIRRTPGRGTVPLPGASQRTAAPMRRASADGEHAGAWFEGLSSAVADSAVKVLSVQVLPCPPAVAESLAIAVGEPVHKATRVRSLRAGPLAHITTYAPQALAPFGRRQLARKPVLELMEEAGVRLGRATQCVSARLADADVARHLDVAVGSALLSVERLVCDHRERPVQWLVALYRPDRGEYHMELARVGDASAKVWVGKAPAAPLR